MPGKRARPVRREAGRKRTSTRWHLAAWPTLPYNWQDWQAAAGAGAALLWRVKADLALPVLQTLPDGSYLSVLVSPKIGGKARQALIDAARDGEELDEGKATVVRVIEYQVPDRDDDGTGELIALITTITDPRAAPAPLLAEAYHQRWVRHEVAWSEWNSQKEDRPMLVA